jgi:hypothetical protein
MGPPLLFYRLLLVALGWLCLMLYWAWPRDRAPALPPPPSVRTAASRNSLRASYGFHSLTIHLRCAGQYGLPERNTQSSSTI